MSQLQVGRVNEWGEQRPLPAGRRKRADHGAFTICEIVRGEVREVAVRWERHDAVGGGVYGSRPRRDALERRQ